MTAWKDIAYVYDKEGSIVLPEGAPFDGNPVLIKTGTGVVEAWWDKGSWTEETPDHPREYDGWCWVCYDDQFQEDLDSAKSWMPIPQ